MSPASSSVRAVLEFEVACELGNVRGAGEGVRAFLRQSGCSQNETMDCELAVVEACNNAIKYVQVEWRGTPVKVQVVCRKDDIEMSIIDHTPGFDWPEKAALPDPEADSGRGVFLIQALMDATRYIRRPGENTLVLRKNRVPG